MAVNSIKRIVCVCTVAVFVVTQHSVTFAAVAKTKLKTKSEELAKKIEQEKFLKKQEEEILAKEHYNAGKQAYRAKDYDKAQSEFDKALSLNPELNKAQSYLDRIAKIKEKEEMAALDNEVKKGIYQYKNGNQDDAIAIFDAVLLKDPENSKASRYKAKALEAKEDAKKGKVTKTDKLNDIFLEGIALYNAGNYDAAMAKFNKIIEENPANIPARRYINHILERKREYQQRDNSILEQQRMLDVRKAWAPPVKKEASETEAEKPSKVKVKSEQLLLMEEKSKQVIPEINFTDAHLRDVVKYLSKISGVNIILDEDLFNAQVPQAGMESTATEPGMEQGMDAETGDAQMQPAAPTVSDKITISLTNIPLIEALKYILKAKGLQYRIDEYAIVVSTPERLLDVAMETRYYSLASGTGQFTVFEMNNEPEQYGGSVEKVKTLGGNLEAKKIVTIKDVLEQSGVPFDPATGAKIFLDQRTGTLIVRNTPSNLAVIEDILRTLDVTPYQISIEAKFVEINNDKTKELGFDVLMGELAVGNRETNAARGRTSIFTRNGNSISDGDPRTGTMSVPMTDMTAGTRSILDQRDNLRNMLTNNNNTYRSVYSSGLSQSTISGHVVDPDTGLVVPGGSDTNKLFDLDRFPYATLGTKLLGSGAVADAPFALTGVLTDPEFQIVMRAIDQSGLSNMLSAPKVTTINNQQAQIKVVTEIIYPAEFEVTPPTISSGDNGVVTPGFATPSEFVTRDVGIILDVTPSAGADRKTIHLTVLPEVSELVNWIDYGIPAVITDSGFTPPIPILQPVFESQRVSTSVVINDGETVILGGLMKDDVKTIKDKTPIFGDIPILGQLFRTEGESRLKKNLLIFITANLLSPAGGMLREQKIAS